jgi:hypothetical protein
MVATRDQNKLPVAVCAAAFLISGCNASGSGSIGSIPVSQRPTSRMDARSAARMYAGGPNANVVDAYPAFARDPNPVAKITTSLDAPTGIAVDDAGNTYVCNNAGQSHDGKGAFWTVTVYPHGRTTAFRTYSDGVWNPVDVAISADGTVYIANISSAVTVYPPRSLHPSLTLQAPTGFSPLGVAIDAGGNVFVSYVSQNSGAVYEYAPGQAQGTNLGIAFKGNPHGLAVDQQGNLVVAISNAPSPGSTIDVFASGAKQPKLKMTGPFQPFMLAFSRNGRRLFAADYGSGNNDGGVFVYSYPDGTLLFKDTQGAAAGAYGVAIDPRAAP